MRILIADDHDLILEGLRSTLADLSSEIVCAPSLDKALHHVAQSDFDYYIIDYALKPGTGDMLLNDVRKTTPRARAICISGEFNAAILAKMSDAGFDAFYDKGDPLDEILDAIKSLDADDVFYSSSVKALMREVDDLPRLSGRQNELLGHIAAGRTNKEAAHQMGVEQATVSFHMKHLKRKLKASNSREIVTRATELGLL